MWISWRDERYLVGNQHRILNCESNQVIWTEAGQFWLPKLFVWNVIELVNLRGVTIPALDLAPESDFNSFWDLWQF